MSGLVCGIDGVVYKVVLQVNGVSIVVLGNGFNIIYFRRYVRLVVSLFEQGGVFVLEFFFDVLFFVYNFL